MENLINQELYDDFVEGEQKKNFRLLKIENVENNKLNKMLVDDI